MFYVLIVAVLFLFRGPRSWESLRDILLPREQGGRLLVAGREVAPDLCDQLLRAYQSDYPTAQAQTSPVGGAYALESLLRGGAAGLDRLGGPALPA